MSDAAPPQTLKDWLEGHRERFVQALPQGSVTIERFIAAATLEILNNPTLQKCDRASLTASLMQSARYGLEVGSLLGQAFLIPYNDRRQLPDGSWGKVMTCHFQVGYKGLIVLARRSRTIKTICAEVVHEHDDFEVELGLHPNIRHKVDIRHPRGEPIAYYCAVELENGGFQFKVLTADEAIHHRDRYSKGFQQAADSNPWTTNPESMALKTVIIKALKLCPMSVEALEAVNREERGMEMRNVTGTGLDALPPPSEEAEIEREEPPTKPEGARPDAARAAAAKAAGRAKKTPEQPREPEPEESPTTPGSDAPTAILERRKEVGTWLTALPEPDQPWWVGQLAQAKTLEDIEQVWKDAKEKYDF